MRSTILFIAVCCLAASSSVASPAENCTVCHRVLLSGIHRELSCGSCHGDDVNTIANPAAASDHGRGCTGCHTGYGRLFQHSMATRKNERNYVQNTFGTADQRFFEKNCHSCHLSGCGDCHGGSGHNISRPLPKDCFNCHRDYFVGMEYFGMAPREENLRYQRGETAYGATFLKMLPDVHAEAGLSCGSCHSMQSLLTGDASSKKCMDCHKVDLKIAEHSIPAHLSKMECYACHSAWAPQEYGTFYLRFAESPTQELYKLKENRGEYVKSVYLKKQDAPPLGINSRGLVSPIRPQFISYFSDIRDDKPAGAENRLLAAQWKAFFPHTIRRGTVMCDGCHDNPRRVLMEPAGERIYDLEKDRMSLSSFWDRRGQSVINGRFIPDSVLRRMSPKNPAYQKVYVKKWQGLLKHVDDSSLR